MRLPGIEYGSVQSLGRERVVRDYQGTSAAEIAGINAIVDATGRLTLAVEERVNNSQVQQAMTEWALESNRIKTDLGTQERITKSYLREQGIDIEGDDDEVVPGYQVRPKLMNKMLDEQLNKTAGRISNADVRGKFLLQQRVPLENYKKQYALEQFKLGRIDMINQLDVNLEALKNAGEYEIALEMIDIAMIKNSEKAQRRAGVLESRDLSKIYETKNHPNVSLQDLKNLKADINKKRYVNITPGQRNRAILEIDADIERMTVREQAQKDYELGYGLVDKYYSPDADSEWVDAQFRKYANNNARVLEIARIEKNRRDKAYKDAEEQAKRDAYNQVIATDDPGIIEQLDVDEGYKDTLRSLMKKRMADRFVNDDELVINLKQMLAGESVEIDGKRYEGLEDFIEFDLNKVADRLLPEKWEELWDLKIKAQADRNNYEVTATQNWEQKKHDFFKEMLGPTPWSKAKQGFYNRSNMLLDNVMREAERNKGAKLEPHEYDALINNHMGPQVYYYERWTKTRQDVFNWRDLLDKRKLLQYMQEMVRSGEYTWTEIKPEDVRKYLYRKEQWRETREVPTTPEPETTEAE